MTTPYANLTERQQSVVQKYDNTARSYYAMLMEVHRIAMELSAIHSQNATLFLTTMDTGENLPIPGGASVMATPGTTNSLNNARIAAEALIADNVSAKAIFRQMLGSDTCEELG
jgi:hypothetical protein